MRNSTSFKIIFVLIYLLTGQGFSKEGLPETLSKIFTVDQTQELSGEALNTDIAGETGDYVLILNKNEDENTVKFFSADGLEKWQKDFAKKEAKWIDIAENGSTIMLKGKESVHLYSQDGTLLCFFTKYFRNYYLSNDGKYFTEQKGNGVSNFYYYKRDGEKVIADLPDKINKNNYLLRFTPYSKILALLTSDQSIRNRTGDSYLVLYDPEVQGVIWSTKIKNGIFLAQISRRHSAISNKYIVLYNNTKSPGAGFYCFNKNGELLWVIEKKLILPESKLASPHFMSLNGDKLIVETGNRHFYTIDIISKEINYWDQYSRDFGIGTAYRKMIISDGSAILYSNYSNKYPIEITFDIDNNIVSHKILNNYYNFSSDGLRGLILTNNNNIEILKIKDSNK